jgi:hypothetical protein
MALISVTKINFYTPHPNLQPLKSKEKLQKHLTKQQIITG